MCDFYSVYTVFISAAPVAVLGCENDSSEICHFIKSYAVSYKVSLDGILGFLLHYAESITGDLRNLCYCGGKTGNSEFLL